MVTPDPQRGLLMLAQLMARYAAQEIRAGRAEQLFGRKVVLSNVRYGTEGWYRLLSFPDENESTALLGPDVTE